jgi:hypothetical protein
LVQRNFTEFEQEVYSLLGGRQEFINEFSGKKAIPFVLMFYCAVAGHTPKPGLVAPMIIKQMAAIGLPLENLDVEARSLMVLFNDYLHDRSS